MADERILARCAAGRDGEFVLSPAEGFWSDCPCVEVDPSVSAYEIFDDFVYSSVGDVTSKWMKDADTGTATLGSAATYGLGGIMVMDTTAAKNKYVGLKVMDADAKNGGFKITKSSGKKLWFAAKVKLTSLADEILYVGLIDGATTKCAADDTGAENLADGVYFRTLTATPTKLDYCVANTAGGETATSDVATLVASTWTTIGFKFDGANTIQAWLNGVALHDVHMADETDFPTAVALTPYLYIHSGNGTRAYMYVDWVKCVQMR